VAELPPLPPLSPDVAELAHALAGQYTFGREIGRGGMGVVYCARDLKLERLVAIKVLPPYLERDADVRERFLREARTAASLSHPNIVPIYRADELDGHVFFVMAYVDGESLAQRVRARGPLPVAEVLPNLCDVAHALAYAHRRSIVHRDVKAENILIDRATGHALIADFGIARVAAAASMTATGQLLGTVWYMSPEQVMGQPIDGRADLYALGVVAFYALAGRFPFEYEAAAAVLVAHATKPAPPLGTVASAVPRAVAAVVDRCLAKDPAARYATGDELARALEEAARVPAPAVAYEEDAPLPAMISETDALALWRRAAELQAETGRQSRPPDVAALRVPSESARATPPTSGYRMGDVLGAASEAGIGEEFVARAAAELGLVSGRSILPPGLTSVARVDAISSGGVAVTSQSGATLPSRWRGAPAALDFEAQIDGEIPESELEMAVEMVRRAMSDVGNVSRSSHSLVWTSTGQQRKAHLTIMTRGGRTTVRASEHMSQLAGGLSVGLLGGVVFLGSLAFAAGFAGLHSAITGFTLAMAVAAGSYGLVRTIYGAVVRQRERQLRQLVGDVAEYFRDSMLPPAPVLPALPAAPPAPPVPPARAGPRLT
jgi:eukaryotic-like serine/threonine-protein kinase